MKQIMSDMSGQGGGTEHALAYEVARELARDPDSEVRRNLAAREDTRPEILYFLAEDASPNVRRVIAMNMATPAPANLILARDKDDEVRCALSSKIGKLMPHLPADAQNRIRDITIEALEILARDQLQRVRQILAETLKDVANVPPHIIRGLARDMEISVAAPILQFSPLLSDNDLVEIIESAPIQGAIAAISRRSALSASLCDAIVTTDDRQAIGVLLGNSSAQVREETLEYIAEQSREVTTWQEPLVFRLRLPPSIVRKLADFVADSLLAVLSKRKDLPPDVLQEVTAVVRQRIAMGDKTHNELKSMVGITQELTPSRIADRGGMASKGAELVKYVQQLHVSGRLNEAVLDEALLQGHLNFVIQALAIMAGLVPTVVGRVIKAQSAKGMTAVAWKAGLGMRFGIKLQTRLACITPKDVLNAKNGTDYPLTPIEMDWMIKFFSE